MFSDAHFVMVCKKHENLVLLNEVLDVGETAFYKQNPAICLVKGFTDILKLGFWQNLRSQFLLQCHLQSITHTLI